MNSDTLYRVLIVLFGVIALFIFVLFSLMFNEIKTLNTEYALMQGRQDAFSTLVDSSLVLGRANRKCWNSHMKRKETDYNAKISHDAAVSQDQRTAQ